MNRSSIEYRLGRITHAASVYRNYVARHGLSAPATRAAGYAYDANVRAALRKGATLTEVAAASSLPAPDPLAEVRAELDTPIDLAAVRVGLSMAGVA